MREPSLLDAYDIIVFDCDGVLLDSNDFKTAIFRAVLIENGFAADEVDRFVEYQKMNFGVSRYCLFEMAINGEFGAVHDVPLETLLSEFGVRCRQAYLEQAETQGMREALQRANRRGRVLYVVSGSDEGELREVLDVRGLSHYFAMIYGSPKTKVDNLRKVWSHRQATSGIEPRRVLFIGESEADLKAAVSAGADFMFMAAYSAVRGVLESKIRDLGHAIIEDLRELK
jgi:phosphoglycolate phosphatase-like HAD superfamily hydrolase